MNSPFTAQSDLFIEALSAIPALLHGFGRRDAQPLTRELARRHAAERLASRGRTLFMRQVHGDRVIKTPFTGTPEADGAIVAESGLIVAVETADCLPIVLVEPRQRIAAIVHAGWRGTAIGIVMRAMEKIAKHGGSAAHVIAVLGPCIRPCCYEIGEELLGPDGPFEARHLRRDADNRLFLDLHAVNREQLERSGVTPRSIHAVDECTRCNPDLYHSFRREGASAGRMINYVGWDSSLKL
jgi:YfiH family protein